MDANGIDFRKQRNKRTFPAPTDSKAASNAKEVSGGSRMWLHDKYDGQQRSSGFKSNNFTYKPRFEEQGQSSNAHVRDNINIYVNNRHLELESTVNLDEPHNIHKLTAFVTSLDLGSEIDELALLIRLIKEVENITRHPLSREKYNKFLLQFATKCNSLG